MIDKYLLEDLSLRSDEKGELARWVIQLQADVDTERRKSASLESVIYARDTRIAELEAIRAAAEKLVRCKGRYHSEQNYRALSALFGVTTPDLPPVDGDSEVVIAELRAKLATPVRLPDIEFVKISGIDFPVMRADIVKKEIRHAGFKVEGDA